MSKVLEKLQSLKSSIKALDGCVVAYSGGVDSTLLAAVAHEVLGDRCLPVIAVSSTYPKREYESAVEWLNDSGIPFVVVESEELDIPGFAENPTNRCYYCKQELYAKIWAIAQDHGLPAVIDGANAVIIADGGEPIELLSSDDLYVNKASCPINLIQIAGTSFYSKIKDRLQWCKGLK